MPTTASVYSSALNGFSMCTTTVASSVATASFTMDMSHSDASEFKMPLMVKATSRAVSGVPSVNFTSSRTVNVQIMPSSDAS